MNFKNYLNEVFVKIDKKSVNTVKDLAERYDFRDEKIGSMILSSVEKILDGVDGKHMDKNTFVNVCVSKAKSCANEMGLESSFKSFMNSTSNTWNILDFFSKVYDIVK